MSERMDQACETIRALLADELAHAAATGMAVDLEAIALEVLTTGTALEDIPAGWLRILFARQIVGPRAWTTCPPWCELEPGHPFVDGDDDTDELARYHQGPTFDAGRVQVHLSQLEHAAGPTGPSTFEPPSATVVADVLPGDPRDTPDRISADDLRSTAAMFLEAADRLDRLDS